LYDEKEVQLKDGFRDIPTFKSDHV
jgi:hypothetical protein